MPGVRSIERKTPARVWPYAAAITFSLTDMFRKRRSVWNVRDDAALADLVRLQPDDALPVERDVARRPGR